MSDRTLLWCAIALSLCLILICVSAEPANAKTVVEVAQAEIGKGEEGGNNKGFEVLKYNNKIEGPWCAGFVSWVLENSDNDHALPYLTSARALWNEANRKNLATKIPEDVEPGDVVVFWRESRSSWQGHVGIVEAMGNGYLYTIEGNVGEYPAKVKRLKYRLSKLEEAKVLGFIKINSTDREDQWN